MPLIQVQSAPQWGPRIRDINRKVFVLEGILVILHKLDVNFTTGPCAWHRLGCGKVE